MDKRELSKVVRAAGRMLLALGFVFSHSAWAAQSQSTKEDPAPASKATSQQAPVKASPSMLAKAEREEAESAAKQNAREETASSGNPHEGIKVHGHWTIEVRNPNGTLATHREFENSYQPSNGMASILARQLSVGYWVVVLTLNTNACVNGGNSCGIYEPAFGVGNPDGPLTVGTSGNNLILSGTMTAQSASSVVAVQTGQYACPSTVAPATSCPLATKNTFNFTGTLLAAPVGFSAGQIVAVTVKISFS